MNNELAQYWLDELNKHRHDGGLAWERGRNSINAAEKFNDFNYAYHMRNAVLYQRKSEDHYKQAMLIYELMIGAGIL